MPIFNFLRLSQYVQLTLYLSYFMRGLFFDRFRRVEIRMFGQFHSGVATLLIFFEKPRAKVHLLSNRINQIIEKITQF
jgi:hypothetical protein